MELSALPATGERLLPSMSGLGVLEHLHRYAIASTLARGLDVLDVACGEGYGSALLAGSARSVVGVDISPDVIHQARRSYQKPNLRFMEGSCTSLPLPNASVDVVVSLETLEHIQEHDRFLAEIQRVLRRGGLLVLSTPERENYNATLRAPNPYHVRELSHAELEALLRGSFAHVCLMGQRSANASVIAGIDAGEPQLYGMFTGNFQAVEFCERIPKPTYLLALCSDAPLPAVPVGPFEFKDRPVMDAFDGKTCFIQAFGDRGAGYSEELSMSQPLAPDAWQTITFGHLEALHSDPMRRIRVDAVNRPSLVEIAYIRIRRDADRTVLYEASTPEQFGQLEFSARLVPLFDSGQLLLLALDDDPQLFLPPLPGLPGTACTLELKLRVEALFPGIVHRIGEIRSALAVAQSKLADLAGEFAAARAGVEERQRALKAACAESAALQQALEGAHAESATRQQALAAVRNELSVIKSSGLWRLAVILRKSRVVASRLLCRIDKHYARKLHWFGDDARVLRTVGLVDARWYCAKHTEEHLQHRDAVMHYLRVGAARGWEPNRMFDSAWYLAQNEDVRTSGRIPAVHYAAVGWREGRNPHPAFDVKWYLENYPDVEASGIEPSVHYLKHGWREGRCPHPLSDATSDVCIMEAIKPWFDREYYLAHNRDVAGSGADPLEHYHFCGEQEGRLPRADFDPSYYVEANPDVRMSELWSAHPFHHFVTCGKPEGRTGKAFLDAVSLRDAAAPPDLLPGSIGVALHIYYPDIWDTIQGVLRRMPAQLRPYVSLVAGRSDHLRKSILDAYPSARIEIVQNRGRDVAPFLAQLRAMQEDGVVAALKIHGKKTMAAGTEYGSLWRDALYEDLAPSTGQVHAIIGVFQSDPDVGIMLPEAHYASLMRGLKTNRIELFQLAAALGISLSTESMGTTPFPAGTMFWFRPAALAGLTRLRLRTADFPKETDQTDGTLAHAIERLICVAAKAEGFKTIAYRGAVRRAPARAAVRERGQNAWRKIRLEKKYPGITRPEGVNRTEHLAFVDRIPSVVPGPDSARPRMNFLVQDMDADIVYGGYIAGLEFAAAMNRHYDIRFVQVVHPVTGRQGLRDKFRDNPRVGPLLDRAESINLCQAADELPVGKSDFFGAFSSWDCLLASKLADACGQPGFLYFCQEDEACFHCHDAHHAMTAHAQRLPQFTIFSTTLLRDHFRANRLGVFARSEAYAERHSAVFDHALTPVAPASLKNYHGRTKTRILVYARPEDHARRNLFEFALLGLREFLRTAAPAVDEVEIVGLGSLAYEAILPLCEGHGIRIMPRLELQNYAEALAGFDIGLSLMYAPHPGLMHFEMATAGLLVVTNTFGVRTAERLTAISPNLIPVEPSVPAIAAGLLKAWERRRDYEGRLRGADVKWNRSWDQAFDDAFVGKITACVDTWLRQSGSTAPLETENALP